MLTWPGVRDPPRQGQPRTLLLPPSPGGPCVGGSFQVTVVSRDGELPEPRWLMPMTVCQSRPGMKMACGDQCGQTSCSPSPRGSFRGPRGPRRAHGNVSSRGGTALRLLCGRGFRGSEARGERWAGRGAVICSVLICTQGSRPPTSRGRLCVFVLFAVSFPSLEKTRPRAFSLSRQMTQTRCLSAGAHVVGSEQPPSQYLADVDTSDEDSLRGLRAARRPSEQRGRPRSERQVR